MYIYIGVSLLHLVAWAPGESWSSTTTTNDNDK